MMVTMTMTIMISRMARTVTMMKMEMLTVRTTLVVATVTPSRCNDSAVLHVFSERASRGLRFPLLCRALACACPLAQTPQPPRVARPWLACVLPSPARRLDWPSPASGATQPCVGRLPSGSLEPGPAWPGPARPGPAWLGTTTVNTRSTHGQHDGQHTVNTTVNIP